jgi:hypothetical protein
MTFNRQQQVKNVLEQCTAAQQRLPHVESKSTNSHPK